MTVASTLVPGAKKNTHHNSHSIRSGSVDLIEQAIEGWATWQHPFVPVRPGVSHDSARGGRAGDGHMRREMAAGVRMGMTAVCRRVRARFIVFGRTEGPGTPFSSG